MNTTTRTIRAAALAATLVGGRMGGIPQTGPEPAYCGPSSSYNDGVGAFMLAGAELKRMVTE
ncbi:hypothetical protein ACFFTM_06185 [Pseudoduganella plicata]|uniref:Uncharacterized protein n=1 Tax=Pseudoduganella plicata TaxID=321984 RepID=A0AA87Y6M8_9BURK|nr:hypothetical protein [Pseudoduganella plicata]GGY83176.1 hypothetical protein GCM10007388_15230 [Pseudoduganella plicata]